MTFDDLNGAFSYANMIYRGTPFLPTCLFSRGFQANSLLGRKGYRGTSQDAERGLTILTDLSRRGHPYAQMALAAAVVRGWELKSCYETV